MSFESDIRIVYLKLLRREPSADEISQSYDKDIFFLEQEIKESSEYKLTSVLPTTVPGAMKLYTFNVKNKEFTELVCQSHPMDLR